MRKIRKVLAYVDNPDAIDIIDVAHDKLTKTLSDYGIVEDDVIEIAVHNLNQEVGHTRAYAIARVWVSDELAKKLDSQKAEAVLAARRS